MPPVRGKGHSLSIVHLHIELIAAHIQTGGEPASHTVSGAAALCGRDEASVNKVRFVLRTILIVGAIGVGAALTRAADAQALGDADCPGGYYFDAAHRLCVPLGYVYTPPDYGYDPGYAGAPLYDGPYYVFIQRHHHDRHRDRDDRDRHDQFRR